MLLNIFDGNIGIRAVYRPGKSNISSAALSRTKYIASIFQESLFAFGKVRGPHRISNLIILYSEVDGTTYSGIK